MELPYVRMTMELPSGIWLRKTETESLKFLQKKQELGFRKILTCQNRRRDLRLPRSMP